MGMYQPEIETMDRNELEKLQLERLQKQVKNVYENVPMYRERMDKKGVKPEDIKELKDLAKLPFTTKQDLRDYYPFELFAADKKDIVRIHASSGTTGRQIVAGYTRNDLDMWADCMARQIAAAGGDENSVVQVSYGYGLFTGGLGAHGGSERIGAMTIPTSSGNTERQIRLMIELGATHLCCTPSYAMYLGETINEMGVKDQLSLKAGIFGAEPWTEDMRHQIEQSLGIKAYDVYGLTEITGPGVSYECSAQNGMHVCEDMFIPEIIDPDTEEVLPPGSFGELVFTTITKEGMPMMRYRTRDLCVLDYEKCECGRTLVRMKKPAGRTDDMLIIRGVNVFPSQIEEVLLKIGGDITPNYQIIVGRENNTDTLEVQVEMSEGMLSDDVKSVAAIEKNIVAKLRSTLGLGAKVTLVEPKTITRSEGKAKFTINREVKAMKLIKQISVFVENKSGRLSDILNVIGKNGIDISALSIADTTDFGIVRMIVNDPDKAAEILKSNNLVVKVTDVIALAVADKPGGLAGEIEKLKNAGISIEYMYAFIGKSDKGALVIVRVENPEKALEVLKDENVTVVSPEEVYRM